VVRCGQVDEKANFEINKPRRNNGGSLFLRKGYLLARVYNIINQTTVINAACSLREQEDGGG
jgi:hypothetical protein